MKKDLNKLTFEELEKELDKIKSKKKQVTTENKGFYQLGEPYMIRTVTMIYTGRLINSNDKELLITEACWIPDTGRWQQACEKGSFDEVEPYPKNTEIIINREAVLDLFRINFELPKMQK